MLRVARSPTDATAFAVALAAGKGVAAGEVSPWSPTGGVAQEARKAMPKKASNQAKRVLNCPFVGKTRSWARLAFVLLAMNVMRC
jgi:hypothetical protein